MGDNRRVCIHCLDAIGESGGSTEAEVAFQIVVVAYLDFSLPDNMKIVT